VKRDLAGRDVASLLSDPSPESRAVVAAKVAANLISPGLTDSARRIAEDIVRLLAKDVAVIVRAAVSHSLRHATRMPRDLAHQLADDVDAVALAFIVDSPVLDDELLLLVLEHASPAKQDAIARRRSVSGQVSGALVKTGSELAVAALMRNHGARIAEASLQEAVDRFSSSDPVHTGMIGREALPVAVAVRLVHLVSERLRWILVSHHQLPPDVAAGIVLNGRERAIIQIGREAEQKELVETLAAMQGRQELTPSLLVRAVCMGDTEFFECALAVMARVKVRAAGVLIHDRGELGMKSLWEKAGMPPRLLAAIRAAVQVADSTELDGRERDAERYRVRVMTRILTQCDGFDPDDVDWLLDKLGDVLEPAAAA